MRTQDGVWSYKGTVAYDGDRDGAGGASRCHADLLGVVVGMLALLVGYAFGHAESGLWERYTGAGNAALAVRHHAEAEEQFQAALDVANTLPDDDPRLATSLSNLAALYHAQKQYAQAEPLYERLLSLRERLSGSMHPQVAEVLEDYAALLRAMHPVRSLFPWSAAEKMAVRAAQIRHREGSETTVDVSRSWWPTNEQQVFSDP